MYIVNTTFVVENQDQERWLDIIKNKYIPFLRDNGYHHIVFTRVISVEAVEQLTYSLQVDAADMGQYDKLMNELFAEYVAISSAMFGERVLWFSSLMKKVEINA